MSALSMLPFLMFQEGKGAAALDFYLSVFPGAKAEGVERHGAGGPEPEGTLKAATLTIGGQSVKMFDSPIRHGFDFTPSFSFFVECASEDELQRLAETLSRDGTVMMPVGDYGFSRLFAWVGDRFGVSWQLNLA